MTKGEERVARHFSFKQYNLKQNIKTKLVRRKSTGSLVVEDGEQRSVSLAAQLSIFQLESKLNGLNILKLGSAAEKAEDDLSRGMDQLSDVSLDSGVHLTLDQQLISPPDRSFLDRQLLSSPNSRFLDHQQQKRLSCPDSSSLHDRLSPAGEDKLRCETEEDEEEDELSDDNNEDDCDSSEFSDYDDYAEHFVSFEFDDYPDSVYCDIEDEDPEPASYTPRRSSVLNPAELYLDKNSQNLIKRSQSIKSRL